MVKISTTLAAAALLLSSCSTPTEPTTEANFITVEDGRFIKNGSPYFYVGTNLWFGAILGSTGPEGNRERLLTELDSLSAIGVKNLRVLVGVDGDPRPSKATPALQEAPNRYNQDIFNGLDFLLSELAKRDMEAVLFLNNSWEWSGGYSQYLEWAGYGKAPVPAEVGWDKFRAYVSQFATSEAAQEIFFNYIKDVLGRTNSITGVAYKDDPTIMSWQIGNEPRAFSSDVKDEFAEWIHRSAEIIDSLAPNHLISIGSEGEKGCEEDIELWERIHSDGIVDYLTVHTWPKNWKWIDEANMAGTIDIAIQSTKDYIDRHLVVADRLGMPLVLEEFGFPRDSMEISRSSSTSLRDTYYKYVFDYIIDAKASGKKFAGCNFWAWGGIGTPEHRVWQSGDDYLGDPAQEPQGLNSIFMSDSSTIATIRYATQKLNH